MAALRVLGTAAKNYSYAQSVVASRTLLSSPSLSSSPQSQFSSPAVRRPDGDFQVTMIPGDGVGPELMHVVKEVFKAAEVPVQFDEHHVSEVHNMASEEKLDEVLNSMKLNRVAIKGKIYTPMEYKGELSSYEMKLRGARHPFSQAMGRNIANPTAMLLSSANMLKHLNLEFHSNLVSEAVKKVIKLGKVRTRDMGGYSTTSDFLKSIIDNLHPPRHR
ncbi:isocitrate dehydrogenase [NAD] subunit beta, mitochondrial-like [Carcharodon carcharias]|uniref:isocitrate dehydrogenase [NAD] subunit beta, mitochondrial-like n=1 Tax=Carcharodon carcharias TaxID=13397 RepID=UPI001B7ECA42|nr:isocitrate dehydrogenase [NAD] subunit beta, mitochondrial-like [Carcharodon carcharias]